MTKITISLSSDVQLSGNSGYDMYCPECGIAINYNLRTMRPDIILNCEAGHEFPRNTTLQRGTLVTGA